MKDQSKQLQKHDEVITSGNISAQPSGEVLLQKNGMLNDNDTFVNMMVDFNLKDLKPSK
ncbi:hypothetical protein [Mucilaginibacter terrenus]|uniref:hypothetical protein n=1 Tax=Mucilaginibacter terrenus TaxID=2482727 RepID=UPI0014028BE5|nr:hypothetical protein [Mucilaginibacter terrenus]